MSLTVQAIKRAEPRAKPYKLADRDSMYLYVATKGSKTFRIDYACGGRRNTYTIGQWPDVDLDEARRRTGEIKAQLKAGRDPAQLRTLEKLSRSITTPGNSFDDFAAVVIEQMTAEGKGPHTIARAKWMRELAAPVIGRRPLRDIEASEVYTLCKSVEQSGRIDTANRLRRFVADVFVRAIALGRASANPAADLHRVLAPSRSKPRAAITDPAKLGAFLTSLDAYHGHPSTPLGLKLLVLTLVRPGELRFAEWPEFDFDDAVWTIPAEKMKMRRAHLVPLSRQAIEVLRSLYVMARGSRYVLPALQTRERPISENTLNYALRRLGISKTEACAHGFRATASTLLNDALTPDGARMWSDDAIERQLAHVPDDRIKAIYDRALHWTERVELMQWWADHLDKLRTDDMLYLPGGEIEGAVPRAIHRSRAAG